MIHSITRKLHQAVQEHYPDSSTEAVERNLRSARDTILRRADPERLRQVVGFTVRITPSVGDLLDSIGYYMEREACARLTAIIPQHKGPAPFQGGPLSRRTGVFS